jgi:hypothetical protein
MPFKLAEDFENLVADKTINGQTSANGKAWATLGSADVAEMFKVVTLEGKKALWCNPSYQQRAYLPLSEPLLAGRTGTLFFRIRYTSAAPIFFYVGLIDDAVPGEWATSVTMSYVTETGNSVSANEDSDKHRLEPNTWHKVWMVADLGDSARSQANQTFRVYIQNEATGGIRQMGDSARSGAAYSDFGFWEYAAGSPLQTFVIHSGYSAPFYIDDVYVDSGAENLSDPTEQPMLTLLGGGSKCLIVCPKPSSGKTSAYEAALILQDYLKRATGETVNISGTAQSSGKNIGCVAKMILRRESSWVNSFMPRSERGSRRTSPALEHHSRPIF